MPEPGGYATHQRGAVRWTLAPGYDVEVVDALRDAAQGPAAEPIKQSLARTVVFAPMGDGRRGVLKHYKCRGVRDVLKAAWAGSKARDEWTMAQRFVRLGIPTARPVAFGERLRCAVAVESWLITEELAHCVTLRDLAEAADRALSADQRRGLVDRLVAIVVGLHANGIFHADLHAANFLVHAGPDDVVVYLLDLHAAHVLPHGLSPRHIVHNLAMLLASTDFGPVRTVDRLRLLQQYCRSGLWPRADRRRLCELVDAQAHTLRAAKIQSRSKRCLINSSTFCRERGRGAVTYRRRDFPPAMIEAAIREHEQDYTSGDPHALKVVPGPTRVTLVQVDGHAGPRPVCVKEYFGEPFAKRLEHLLPRLLRHWPARRSFAAAHGLLVRQVGAPAPLAARIPANPLRGMSSYFLSVGLEGSLGADVYAATRAAGPGQSERRRAFAAALGRFFRHIHQMDVWHRDLKATNVRATETAPGQWAFHLVDLDRVCFCDRAPVLGWLGLRRPLTRQLRVRNLAQIHAAMPDVLSRADRLRFLHAYTASPRLTDAHKALARDVLAAASRRVTAAREA